MNLDTAATIAAVSAGEAPPEPPASATTIFPTTVTPGILAYG
jgi:hypothetical protein